MNTLHPQRGFTIVETLVAITILMIAIAGPLSIASKGLTAAVTSRDQMVATYLAQESLEVVKNVRDNNVLTGASWINNMSSCTGGNKCDADYLDSSIKTGLSTYPLKVTSSNTYSHDSSGTATGFSRYFFLSQSGGSTSCLSTDAQCLVTVSVSWNEGIVPYQVLLSTEILNASR